MGDLEQVNQLAGERGYKNRDEITVSPEKMGDIYEAKVKSFFDEHLHEDEEIRYIRDGYGYFDVRNKGDNWVRIYLEKVGIFFFCDGPGDPKSSSSQEGRALDRSGEAET